MGNCRYVLGNVRVERTSRSPWCIISVYSVIIHDREIPEGADGRCGSRSPKVVTFVPTRRRRNPASKSVGRERNVMMMLVSRYLQRHVDESRTGQLKVWAVSAHELNLGGRMKKGKERATNNYLMYTWLKRLPPRRHYTSRIKVLPEKRKGL